jgi:hypothetical protein
MGDSYFVFGVLAMLAMVLGVRSARRPPDEDSPGQAATQPQAPKPPKPALRQSPGKRKKSKRGK